MRSLPALVRPTTPIGDSSICWKTRGHESEHWFVDGFDLPTLMGRDSDDPLSAGEVGRCGVAIDTIEDMERLYADIPLDKSRSLKPSTARSSDLGHVSRHGSAEGIFLGPSWRNAAERHFERIPQSK